MSTNATALAAHLEGQYGVEVERVTEIESVYRVDKRDGTSWIARAFPPSRPAEAVAGDADVLRFLERNEFPAERCAAPAPVSMLAGQAVLVTGLVAGRNSRGDQRPALMRQMGDLLGRLQNLPDGNDATARPAGSWHHLSVAGGSRREDIRALEPLLADSAYAPLRDELARIDVLEDLPRALVHPDFTTPNVMDTPDGPVLIDWTGAGRGPRIAPLGMVLSETASNLGLIDAIVAGYRAHVRLEPAELDRLPGAVRAFGLVLDCWMGVHYRGLLPKLVQELPAKREQAETIAARARAAFAAR